MGPSLVLEIAGSRLRARLVQRIARLEETIVRAKDNATKNAARLQELARLQSPSFMPQPLGHVHCGPGDIETHVRNLETLREELTWLHDSIEPAHTYKLARFDLGLFGGFETNSSYPMVGAMIGGEIV